MRPLNENSFQNFVPTGSSHFSRSATLICEPSGSRTQRRFVAPSLHNGYCGENVRLRGSIFSFARVGVEARLDRRRGATGAVAPVSDAAVARTMDANRAAATVVIAIFMMFS